ncbi:MAG: glycine cleavage system aminomethyltransferase GcvT, partial [Bacteroidetes bacterium]|nr:glycine cleavage system aminomethyltransferase GcvT [Bacteroidota bacterium]
FIVEDRMVARHGAEVFINNEKVGFVTSGSMSPMLNKNIGMAYVATGLNGLGNEINILVRDRKIKAQIVKTPFI